jgi:hypothetical protein
VSYCRFGSDGGKSDVYVWHDCAGGWRIMVAECKIVGRRKRPKKCPVLGQNWDITKKIGLPHDGGYFSCRTRKATEKKLLELREIGYHVPEDALQRLRAEMGKGAEHG